MIWSGLLTLGVVGYQLYVTDWINAGIQEDARQELTLALQARRQTPAPTVQVTPSTVVDTPTTVTTEPIVLYPEDQPSDGLPFAEIRIPDIGVDEVMFSGVEREVLKQGPGHMPWTPLPGQPGNAVVSGHRTTYGRPFFDLDRLTPGDVIEVETAIGTHVYTVRQSVIVEPTDVWVTEPRPGAWLTLTTCNPKYSAAERLIVFAEMTAGPNLAYVEFLARPADVS